MINNLQRALVLETLMLDKECSDPNDAFLLVMVVKSDADYLVTGDKRAGLLQRGHIGEPELSPLPRSVQKSFDMRMFVSVYRRTGFNFCSFKLEGDIKWEIRIEMTFPKCRH